MSMVQVVWIGLCGTVLALTLKKQSPELALLVGLAAGALIVWRLLDTLGQVVTTFRVMAEQAGVSSAYVAGVLKVIGISYMAEFGAQVCADAGQSSLASKVELAGKVMILAVAAPILLELVQTIMGLFL